MAKRLLTPIWHVIPLVIYGYHRKITPFKAFDILPLSQLYVKLWYIESIHNMRKPVISSEINPKFDGVPTACILPVSKLYAKLKYIERLPTIAELVISSYPTIS